VSRIGAAGLRYQNDLRDWLRAQGLDVERLVLTGKLDEGDIAIRRGGLVQIIEAKAEKDYNIGGGMKEAIQEAQNYAKARGLGYTPEAFLVIKRRNHPIDKSYVVQELRQWIRFYP
jgi:hypothetical protein